MFRLEDGDLVTWGSPKNDLPHGKGVTTSSLSDQKRTRHLSKKTIRQKSVPAPMKTNLGRVVFFDFTCVADPEGPISPVATIRWTLSLWSQAKWMLLCGLEVCFSGLWLYF